MCHAYLYTKFYSNPVNGFDVIFKVYLISLSEFEAIQRRRLFSNSSAANEALLIVQVCTA
jgi:hypothetical protein